MVDSPRCLVDGLKVACRSGHVPPPSAGVAKPTELAEAFDDGDHVAGCGEGGHEGEEDVEVESAGPCGFLVIDA